MKIALALLLALPLASIASAAPKPAAKPANPGQPLVDMEAAWSKAIVARDTAAMSRIVAADWHGQNERGKRVDRAAMLKEFSDPTNKTSSMNNHDVTVRYVNADLAIVQGMDTEVGSHKGKSTSGTYSWTDVFQKRGANWVAIASQTTPVK